MPALPRPSFAATIQTPVSVIPASPIRPGASTAPPTTAMSIIQNLVREREPPRPDVPVEEQKRRWIDRVATFSRLVRAYKEKEEAEEELRLQRSLATSERFAQAAGVVQVKLEESVRESNTRAEEATAKYDTLVQEFITSDFWPVPQPGQVPDTDESLRHYYWTLDEGLKRVERKLTQVASGRVATPPRTPEAGADVDVPGGVEDAAPENPPARREVDAAVVNEICEKVIAVVAGEIATRLAGVDEEMKDKVTTRDLEVITNDVTQHLQALDKKFVDEIARLDTDRDALAEAATMTFQLASKVNEQLDPAVRVIEQDLRTISDHIESTTREERTTTDGQIAQLRASIKSEAEKTAATAKDLVDNERSARTQLEATVKNHSSQLSALDALKAENITLKGEQARLEAEIKTMAATTQRLTAAAEESEKKLASQAESITALQQNFLALQAQAATSPSIDSMKAEIIDVVVGQLREEMKPVLEELVETINNRLNDHTGEIFSSVIAKLQPMLKVNEAIYTLFKKHELDHMGTPPITNGSHRGPDGTLS
ncbi:hypothetical protein AURDEDRAFT_110862 [Auricularia subglabra TFB-10046 SS5]|nr:hypothetical protein AURDEDRAFT_110862 [Auricularia subglabra TFB-10046 SS5]